MITLLYCTRGVRQSAQRILIDHLFTRETVCIDTHDDVDAFLKRERPVDDVILYIGAWIHLPIQLVDVIHIVDQLTVDVPQDFPPNRRHDMDQLCYVVNRAVGIFIIPRASDPFYSTFMTAIPTWEESIPKKCWKSVIPTINADGSRNIMRSNECLRSPPIAIPPIIDGFMRTVVQNAQRFLPLSHEPNHLWVERLSLDYTTMGYHCDRRLDLRGDIMLYTDYSPDIDVSSTVITARDIFEDFDRKSFTALRWLYFCPKKSSTALPTFSIPMGRQSLVVVSENANDVMKHAIRGPPDPRKQGFGEAMILTHRCSRTWVTPDNIIKDIGPLRCIRDDDVLFRAWLHLCRTDNAEQEDPFRTNVDAQSWTVSPSDLINPIS